jgi:16S rRNA (guanine(966)-N(2))-methyltransferase RsmD
MVTKMRIISGSCKGRKLKAVPGKSTRPTADKMKETIFNWIGPYFDGGLGLDLFAGSGGLGLEALSRGFSRMIFVDHDKYAIQTVKENVSLCNFQDQCEVYQNDAHRALRAVAKRGLQFDAIFIDPPYQKQIITALLKEIDKRSLLKDSGYTICEHAPEAKLPDSVGKLQQIKQIHYGMSSLSLYVIQDDKEGELA